jgi:hypothetical protein
VVTTGDGRRDGSAGVVGLSAADRSAERVAQNAGIQPGRIRQAPSGGYARCAYVPQKSRKSGSGKRWLLPFRNLDLS